MKNALELLQVSESGVLVAGGENFRCAIGKAGFTGTKREGDHATPRGNYPLRAGFFRADRFEPPLTRMPLTAIRETDGWCDAPGDDNYNRLVSLPYPTSHERLWREDACYDVIIPIGYNDDPVVHGKGSAIFMHVATPGYDGTEGCIALNVNDWMKLLPRLTPATRIQIGN